MKLSVKLMLQNITLFFMLITTVSAETSKEMNIEDFVKNMHHHQGFYSFYYDDVNGKIYLEIEQFQQQFIFQSALPNGVGSNDIGLDRGQLGETRLVQFERVGKKVFLRQLNTHFRANSDNALEQQAVNEAFATSIIWGFKVVSNSNDKQKSKVLIDYTPFLLSDIHHLAEQLKDRKQGHYKIDATRSGVFIKRSKAFPDNTELEATITYTGSEAGAYLRTVTPDATSVSVNLHHSLIRLPDDGYQTRKFHPFSGFWQHAFADYASAIEEPLIVRNIPRHRLRKADASALVSEPVKPIIYYLDPGVPEPIKSALIDGALWWDQAFQAIGYKNAFQVKMLPKDADPMDVRYNVIQWVHRATRGWSYGASVIDPRTGEIIKGHVTLGSLRVRQDYLIALGLTSPFEKANADTSKMKAMALARIRQLSAHEVGHTLGIAHNFAASSNNRASVMDYPHPYITIKNGEIDLSDAYAVGIGEWDKYVIAYGYADIAQQDEAAYLEQLVTQAQAKGLHYMSDPDARSESGAHNTGHLWDNGVDAAQELMRVLEVRKLALSQFGINSIDVGTPLSELEQSLVPIYYFHRYQVEAAVKLIAGVDYSYQLKKLPFINKQTVVSGERQQAALNALLKTLTSDVLVIPQHITKLIPPKAYGYRRDRESFISKTGVAFDPISAAQASAKHTLSLLLNAERLARLQQQAALDDTIPSVETLLQQLVSTTIKSTNKSSSAALVQQRVNLQLVTELLTLWQADNVVPEVKSEVFITLNQLNQWLKDKYRARKYKAFKAHFSFLSEQIDRHLQYKSSSVPRAEVNLPPGSPIGN